MMKGPFKLNPILGSLNDNSNRVDTNNKAYNWSPRAPGINGALIGYLSVAFDQAVITDHCLRLSNSQTRASVVDEHGYWLEREGVIVSKFK